MTITNYPKITVILRGYSYEEAMTVISCLAEFPHQLAVEVTTNNPDYLRIIKDAREQFDGLLPIGVGTILNLAQAKEAIAAGAQFMLGPCEFSPEIFSLAEKENVLTAPAALTSSEVKRMQEAGADIIKIFPASTVGPDHFKQLLAPLGPLPLMAVGGVHLENAQAFLEAGASYLGIGSSMFKMEDIKNRNKEGLQKTIETWLNTIKEVGG
ncbi:2-dehydro-3-deoxyphosphogluconate aldolase/(4S)-4-hydroxy-2-oxoglutarate aldolase [Streptococcus rupicaprae]|uniref:2-dehydro-3-deoxyphosphogluconate aldolase/(4S)-4-hydroxy-2-oxoglutarate aldolase n=1 Tax=Streptococcus rupicaprae TaxID=759619 RepID=A0ABV2FKE7_9STRE